MSRRSPEPLTPEQWQTVVDNLHLVYWTIRRMNHPNRQAEADAEDAGLDGLISAVRRWREGRARFSYYAWFCIRRRVHTVQHAEAKRRERSAEAVLVWSSGMVPRITIRDDVGDNADAALSLMRPSERMAAILRFGLDGGGERSLPKLAPLLGLRGPSGAFKRVEGGLARAREGLRGGLETGR